MYLTHSVMRFAMQTQQQVRAAPSATSPLKYQYKSKVHNHSTLPTRRRCAAGTLQTLSAQGWAALGAVDQRVTQQRVVLPMNTSISCNSRSCAASQPECCTTQGAGQGGSRATAARCTHLTRDGQLDSVCLLAVPY